MRYTCFSRRREISLLSFRQEWNRTGVKFYFADNVWTTLGVYVETEVSSLHFTTDCRSEIIRVTTPLLCQVRACLPVYKMYVLHFNLSTLVRYKVIINIQCVQVKCISSLFATNLNDFNIHLFGQTVWYSASPSLNV